MNESLDLRDLLVALEDALAFAESIGSPIIVRDLTSRGLKAQRAAVSKDLLLLAHLCDVARVAASEAYFDLR